MNKYYPFTHSLQIWCRKDLSPDAQAYFLRQFFLSLQRQLRKDDRHSFDGIVYPESHGRSSLHWHGLARVSDSGETYIRGLLRKLKKDHPCKVCLVKIKTDVETAAKYVTGHGYAKMIHAVSLLSANMPIRTGLACPSRSYLVGKVLKDDK